MKALHDTWYVAAIATEVGATAMFNRRIVDILVLNYRLADGTAMPLHRLPPV